MTIPESFTELKKHQFTASEIRGIILVLIGFGTLLFYYNWWLEDVRYLSAWLYLLFPIAFAYSSIQIFGNWVLYLATHHRHLPPADLLNPLSVDVYVTAYKEDPKLIERCLSAAVAMRGDHETYLLDDGRDPALAEMAAAYGAHYLTRTDNKHAKAGNINAALPRTNGDIIVIFDIDHAPYPDFLERTIPHFNDPTIGFVQVMLTFINDSDGWVARSAAETSEDFYNPTSIGADGLNGASLIGTNALIRRKALDSIGGYQPGLAEDLATSITIHAAKWRSVYVHEPLAPGYAPPDLVAWFTQQLKWARGVFDMLLTAYPRYFPNLNPGQRLAYIVRMTYYWAGPFFLLHLITTTAALLWPTDTVIHAYQDYLIHFTPMALMTLVIRTLALRRWRHPSLQTSFQWKPIALVFATWPIYTVAWVMAVLRVPLKFRPTPKSHSGNFQPVWLVPQFASVLLLLLGILIAIVSGNGFAYPLVLLVAAGQLLPQLALFMLLAVRWLKRLVRSYIIAPMPQTTPMLPSRPQGIPIALPSRWDSNIATSEISAHEHAR